MDGSFGGECSTERPASASARLPAHQPSREEAATEIFPRLDRRHPSAHGPWVMDPWSIPPSPTEGQIDREGTERRGGRCGRGWRPNLLPEDAVRRVRASGATARTWRSRFPGISRMCRRARARSPSAPRRSVSPCVVPVDVIPYTATCLRFRYCFM